MAISISIFFASFAGIVLLVAFRLWELQRGARVAQRVRAHVDEWVDATGRSVRARIPTLDHSSIARVFHVLMHYSALILLALLKMLEKKIFRVLEYVRGRRKVSRGVTNSDFLKSVSAHKQSLGKERGNSVE
ncbi:MAG: hypothetical protein OQJ98_01235 [Candidatus Pacebacteria bacterium]|nr:hypothetical protein [Candidatus Paceibacterota bacterium]